ncbi:MAG TPA: glycoside hydrolase family 15 protein [Ktedonobacterales bacterium]|jgi:GH15 family glucan-1,4-alpha-glucosidase
MEQTPVTSTSKAEPRYQPISQYGVIGDCRTAALVGPNGSIDWCCLPHFDSPAIFCRLLDAEKGGFFRLSPVEQTKSSLSYLPGTNILETLFTTSSGRLRVLDFMPIRPRSRRKYHLRLGARFSRVTSALASAYERELGNDVAAAHRLQRMVTCLEGEVELEITLKATFDYARQTPQVQHQTTSSDAASLVLSAGERFLVLVVRCVPASGHQPGTLHFQTQEQALTLRASLHAGDQLVAALQYARSAAEAQGLLQTLLNHPFQRDLDETHAYWHGWSERCHYQGDYAQAVWRSALALKLCTFEPSGAIVAAPTTSLPEWVGGVRNWDYRYTWLRDSVFTLQALANLGYYDEARHYFHFLHDLGIKHGEDLRIMYSVRGESGKHLHEQVLEHLEGYGGSRPVRIGNGAALQRQLDVYGEVADAAYRYLRHTGFHQQHDGGDGRDVRALATLLAEYVLNHAHDKDRGIWEVRGQPQAFVYSRAMCWAALDRACKIASHYRHNGRLEQWARVRDALHADILAHGYNERLQSFTQAYGSNALDASNLRLLLTGFLPPDDPRMVATVETTAQRLAGPGGLIYRYRAPEGEGEGPTTDDGLPGKEGAFLVCTFWLIESLCYLGRVDEARERFEQLLAFASPLGLFSEEVDPDSGEHLGNYPQAFTHIGLINSAITLQRAQEGRLTSKPHEQNHR